MSPSRTGPPSAFARWHSNPQLTVSRTKLPFARLRSVNRILVKLSVGGGCVTLIPSAFRRMIKLDAKVQIGIKMGFHPITMDDTDSCSILEIVESAADSINTIVREINLEDVPLSFPDLQICFRERMCQYIRRPAIILVNMMSIASEKATDGSHRKTAKSKVLTAAGSWAAIRCR